jgi:16S rRNA (cytosine1402-N4)-methyltransferase
VAEAKFSHIPVLLKEAIDFLAVRRGGRYVDATLGLGGHSYEIAKLLGREGRLIGFDKDPAALMRAQQKLSEPPEELKDDWPEMRFEHGSFAQLGELIKEGSIDGLLADLGVSSLQLEDASRGFSFQADGPLDMRMNPQEGMTADQVVNRMDETSLANVIYEFGEERRSRRIARAIVRARPIRTTRHLVEVVSAAARPMNSPASRKSGDSRGAHFERIHPATRTFQGIRIFVNRELDDVRALLESAPTALKQDGRLVVISFHSLEDRIVKDAIREGAHKGVYEALTKKPVTATEEEIESNPRSRSAKLRAARRT